ncbi:hypothetical protein C4577_07395 [Candidatus Parcubacteria bacterium]|nr:MAG: hypothetical protein C4577_07395 [Candidatus Parcubacteria bacterium]
MENVTIKIQPNYDLVEWAEKSAVAIAYPKDRAWYFVDCHPPNGQPINWDCTCYCSSHSNVRLRRYTTQNEQNYCYLGQCRSCQKIFWNYTKTEEQING